MRKAAAPLSALGVLVFTLACSAPPKVRYYVLHLPSGAGEESGSPLAGSLAVGRFTIDPAYAGPRLVYRTSPYRVDFYHYHNWASAPEEQVRRSLAAYLASSGLFREVLLAPTTQATEYRLSGEIWRLCEADQGGKWYAELTLALHLMRVSDGRLVWNRVFRKRLEVEQRNPEGVVQALSAALQQAAEETVREVRDVLARGRSR